jgi:large subunit ribosomal protein L30
MPPTDKGLIKIKLVKSPIGHNPRNRATVKALGLRKVGHVVEKVDNESVRGMIQKVYNLLVVETVDGAAPVFDSTNPGCSARMVNAKIHRIPKAKAAPVGEEPAPEPKPKASKPRAKKEAQ